MLRTLKKSRLHPNKHKPEVKQEPHNITSAYSII